MLKGCIAPRRRITKGKSMKPAALVTGARRGIGRASCVALAQKGFEIVGADISAEGAEDTRAAVEAAGGRFTFLLADVGDTAAHGALLDAAWVAYGGLECLANIAGVQVQTRQDPDGVRGTTNDCGFSGIAYSG